MSQPEYNKFFTKFYDILHSHLDDVKAYKEIAERFSGEILELGSGTGRILIPLAREGNTVTGLEASENMLETCREKLDEEEDGTVENIDLIQGDMRNFHLDKRFGLILAPCNLINYLIDLSDMKKTLSCIKTHLSENGVLVIDNILPDIEQMVDYDGEEQVFEYKKPENGRKVTSSFTVSYDFIDQIEHQKIVINEYEDEEKTKKAEVKETLTFYFPRELREIIRAQGYEIFEERGSLHKREPINEESEEMVFFCRTKS